MRHAAVFALAVLAAGCPPVEPGAKPHAQAGGEGALLVVLLAGALVLAFVYAAQTADLWRDWARRRTQDLLEPRAPEPDKPCPYCGARGEGA